MALADQTALPDLLAAKVHIVEPKIKSGSANPTPKLTRVIAGMCAGADDIDDLGVVRSGGMPFGWNERGLPGQPVRLLSPERQPILLGLGIQLARRVGISREVGGRGIGEPVFECVE
jgi:hypothetical protein